jgi:acyl-coenzyme A synthetase/AMP-(fatty) acid ligase
MVCTSIVATGSRVMPLRGTGKPHLTQANAAPTGPVRPLIDADVRSWLAEYKVPRDWRFVEAFPMTVTGKIQKFRLRDAAIETA